MSETLWMIEYEKIEEDFAASKIDEQEVRSRLKSLGFDPDEINEHIDVLMEDRDGQN